MKKVYSIFLSDEKIINYLDKIPNKSQYFRELVQRDMEKEPFTKEQIAYIRKMMKEQNGDMPSREEDKLQKETANAIDDLLNNF